MMKITLIISLLLVMLTAGAHSDSKDVKVKRGKNFRITMLSNPTTGYMWRWNKGTEAVGVDSVGHRYNPPKSKLSGAGGTECWIFKATKRGCYTLSFDYQRSWEKVEPAKTMQVKVTVY